MAVNLDEGNWVPLVARIRKTWIWEDPEILRAWVDLLFMQNRKYDAAPNHGDLPPLEPGQVATTYQAMAERWGLSRDRVRRAVKRLEIEHSVTLLRFKRDEKTRGWVRTKSDRSILVLTLVNSLVRKSWLAERADKRAEGRAGVEVQIDSNHPKSAQKTRRKTRTILEVYPTGLNKERGTTRVEASTGQPASTRVDETPPPPPLPPAGGNGEHKGVPPASPPEFLTPEYVAKVYRESDPTVPLENCITHIKHGLRKGAGIAFLSEAVHRDRATKKIWDIVDGVVAARGVKPANPGERKCGNCGGSRTVAGGVVDGKIVLKPCGRCSGDAS